MRAGGQYSVPHQLAGQAVHVRRHGEQVVIIHAGPDGPAEVARHQVTTPGSPRVDDAHYPPAPPGALGRTPKAHSKAEAQFLAIGDGAALSLAEAAAAGATRVRAKMARAVQLAAPHGTTAVDQALRAGRDGRKVRRARPGRDHRPLGVRRRGRGVPGRRAAHAGAGHRRVGTPRRTGDGPMTAGITTGGGRIELSSEEAAYLRQVLLAAAHLGIPPWRAGRQPAAGGGDRRGGRGPQPRRTAL